MWRRAVKSAAWVAGALAVVTIFAPAMVIAGPYDANTAIEAKVPGGVAGPEAQAEVAHEGPAVTVAGAAVSPAVGAPAGQTDDRLRFTVGMMVLLGCVAFACEFVDSSLGMGYGTLLTPVLVSFFGLKALCVVPAVLFSELCTGLLAGAAHHRAGNVSLHPSGRPFKVAAVLVAAAVVASFLAANVAARIPEWTLKLAIAVVVLTMGIVILALRNRRFSFSWKKIAGLGFMASFNKGMTGGGYGPLVMSGQLLTGVEAKHAVGTTAFAEGLTCVVGVLTYALIRNGAIQWGLALPMMAGAALSVPVAVWAVKKMPVRKFTLVIGAWTIVLGVVSFWKLWPDLVKAFVA